MDGDRELIGRAKAGDEAAFAELVRRHETHVRRLATGFLQDPVEAEDAAQEVFLKAWRALDGFREDAAISTWLHRITVNHCQDALRSRKRRPWLSWEGIVEALGREPASAGTGPGAATGGTEARELVARVLEDLPEDYRTALLLREVNGLSYQEIAATIRTSLDGVKARLRRARAAALESLRHLQAGEPSNS